MSPTRLTNFDDYFWSLPNQGIRFGESFSDSYTYTQDDQVVWMRDGVYSIFDTAASEIYISILWYESLIEKLFEKATTTYETKNGATYASCTANYPNLYFMLDGYWLQIPPEDYLVDISEA